jgi:outer membrane lipoprotein SlyB
MKNINKIYISTTCLIGIFTLTGCATTGEEHAANVYKAGQVNTRQEAKTVQILAVMPAKIEVSNEQQKKAAQVGGAVAGAVLGGFLGNKVSNNHRTETTTLGALGGGAVGAAAGSMVKDTVLVDGVSLTYLEDGKTLNSAQVGRTCEFKTGTAIVISTSSDETRIQPNTTCPA